MQLRVAPMLVPVVLALWSAVFPVNASADAIHVVQPGETLTSVAATDGLSIAALAAANGLSPNAELIIGEVLLIPPQTPYTAATSAATSTTTAGTRYVSETTVTNAGDTTSNTTGNTTSDTTTTTTTTQQSTSSGLPIPTDERVSATEIAEIADSEGVPAALAEGIAWQESGWNNDVVSSLGAVGVMQIVPGTWSWINTYLTPADPLEPASAAENIRGGVLLLHDLLSLTADNWTLTAAAYFQGLVSVRKYGVYPQTQQYVDDVLALAARFAG